jgi:hypothetical protein
LKPAGLNPFVLFAGKGSIFDTNPPEDDDMPTPSRPATEKVIAEALEKNKAATEDVKQAADDLAVVHTVLDQNLRDAVQDGDIEQAVEHAGQITRELDAAAKKLDSVNETLADAQRIAGSQSQST